MRVVLVRPFYHSHLVTPPLGLGYLASALKRAGHAVELIDALREGLPASRVVSRCMGADVVGITCMSGCLNEVVELSRGLRNSGVRVSICGPHATVMPSGRRNSVQCRVC